VFITGIITQGRPGAHSHRPCASSACSFYILASDISGLSFIQALATQKKSEDEVRDIQWSCLHHNHSRYKASTYSHLVVIFYMCMLLQRQAPVFPLCAMKLTYSVVRCVDLLSPNLVTGVLSLATGTEGDGVWFLLQTHMVLKTWLHVLRSC